MTIRLKAEVLTAKALAGTVRQNELETGRAVP